MQCYALLCNTLLFTDEGIALKIVSLTNSLPWLIYLHQLQID